MRAAWRQRPDQTGGDNRRSHDVEDVDAEYRDRIAAGTDDERLKAEEKREDEDFEAAPADGIDAGARCSAPRGRAGRQSHADAGQPEKQRRREAAKDASDAKPSGVAWPRASTRRTCAPRSSGARPGRAPSRCTAAEFPATRGHHTSRSTRCPDEANARPSSTCRATRRSPARQPPAERRPRRQHGAWRERRGEDRQARDPRPDASAARETDGGPWSGCARRPSTCSPAKDRPSASTGDGPAIPALSMTSPEDPPCPIALRGGRPVKRGRKPEVAQPDEIRNRAAASKARRRSVTGG